MDADQAAAGHPAHSDARLEVGRAHALRRVDASGDAAYVGPVISPGRFQDVKRRPIIQHETPQGLLGGVQIANQD